MRIDIDQIKLNGDTALANHSTISRKIIAKILGESNKLLSNRQFLRKIVVGEEIMDYISDIPGFNIIPLTPKTKPDILLEMGSIAGITVYRDYTYKMKVDEVLFFNEKTELPFYNNYLRQKKLERILK